MRSQIILSAVVAMILSACSNQGELAGAPLSVGDKSSLLEESIHQVDLGKASAETIANLESITKDESRSRDERDQALMALSRAAEGQGNKDTAIEKVEAILAAHEPGGRWPLAAEASRRLRELLTGDARDLSMAQDEPATVAPFAKAILEASYKNAGCTAELGTVIIGGSRATSLRLGTFAVGDALREAQKSNPLCGKNGHTNESSSREGSWTAIPTHAAKYPSSLVVFAFDEASLSPSRYDSYLPMKSAEIRAHLEKNEGLIVVKQRPNAPPVILLAAPRFAQLALLEEKLAVMSSIPGEPVLVPFEAKLLPSEIQSVVRGSYGKIRQCYEATLGENAKNQGKAILRFSITGDGKVGEHRVELEDGLTGNRIGACLDEALKSLVFPSLRGRELTTVVYPVTFSPK